jgi:predicted enzyme related to lactoylglutathione lyase
MKTVSDHLGRFVWFDLKTTDAAAAEEFYMAVVGWETAPWEGSEMPYTLWMAGETAVGGLGELDEEAREQGTPPHWSASILVEDVDATVTKAVGLGASVLIPATDIPGAGRFAVLRDPQGAVFEPYSTTGEIQTSGTPKVGEFSWCELMTTDWEAAFAFYSELFGWQKGQTMEMGSGTMYQIFAPVDMPNGGIYNKPDEIPWPMWLYYVRVEDIDIAAERVKELGGQINHGPMEVPGGDRVAICLDPQGGMFALHRMSAENSSMV